MTSGFNDIGQVAFHAFLADGRSGMFLYNPANSLPGDFNLDGSVDAADYVVWRKTDGTQTGYDTWRTNFGQTAGSGSGASANATVPEPTTLVLLIVAACGSCLQRRQCE